MSSRLKSKQNTTKMPDPDDDEPVGKRLRRNRTTTANTTCEPTPSTSSSAPAKSRAPAPKSRTSASKSNKENAPPTASNSLLHLNDKGLQALFERLDIENLCQMANVCKRFRTVAEQLFTEKYKQFKVDGRNSKISIVRRVLCKFGHLMTSFDASEAYFDDPSAFDIGALAKYCSNDLTELQLRNVTIDCAAAAPLFRRLKKLDLTMCDFTGSTKPQQLFATMPQLEFLGFEANGMAGSCHYLVRLYPKLQELNFDISYPGYFTFLELVTMNPQLRRIIIFGLPEDIFIEAVAKSTKSLERLMITPGFMSSTPEIQTKAGLLQLSKLKQLKKLRLNAGYEIYGKLLGPLMDAFAKEKIQLDQLELSDFLIRSKDIKSLLKIKSMEIMVLNAIEQADEADVIAMATEMPQLSTLHLYFGKKVKNPVTIDGLTKIVKERKKLTYLALIDVQNLKIDQKVFQNLLKVAQNRRGGGGGSSGSSTSGENEKRLFIDIYGNKKTTSFNVPDAMQKSAEGIFKIRYSNED